MGTTLSTTPNFTFTAPKLNITFQSVYLEAIFSRNVQNLTTCPYKYLVHTLQFVGLTSEIRCVKHKDEELRGHLTCDFFSLSNKFTSKSITK